jgi:hypothetical protein
MKASLPKKSAALFLLASARIPAVSHNASGKLHSRSATQRLSLRLLRRTNEAGAQMPNSNDVASVEMLWENVLSLLVVGASVFGGSAVFLVQVMPPIIRGFS